MLNYLVKEISKIPNIILNKSNTHYSPYVLNFSVNGLKGETLMHFMEQQDIYLGTGSACNAKTKNFLILTSFSTALASFPSIF